MQDSDEDVDNFEAQQNRLDFACQCVPFFYAIGFVIVYSAIWLKTWRLHKLFNNPKLIKLKIHNQKLQGIQLLVLTAVVLINVVWYLVDPLTYTRKILEINGDQVVSYAFCTSDYWYAFVAPLAIMLLTALCYGLFLLYAIWFIPNDFNESKWISFSLVTAFEALVVPVP